MNIIITGASRGIGYSLAKKFGQHRDHNILVISRNKEKLISLKEEKLAGNIIPYAFDLEELPGNREGLARFIDENFEQMDVLINNAGYLSSAPFEAISYKEMLKMFQVNVLSAIELTKICLPLLKKSKKAHVVNISSMGGFQGSVKFSGLSIYSSSKAALAGLTECLAEEYKDSPVSCNWCARGAVQTEMLEEAFPGYKAPLKSNEMADFIYDFAINGHTFFNGKILPVTLSNP